jgi:uncharacterized ion transporter superfamily protein YfcC
MTPEQAAVIEAARDLERKVQAADRAGRPGLEAPAMAPMSGCDPGWAGVIFTVLVLGGFVFVVLTNHYWGWF